jgi:hypothetical protein
MNIDNFDPTQTPLSSMRFQSHLGKEAKRRYKEGSNIVRLSMARVTKVNYKYNTVDVVTTLYKNSTTRNPVDNGKFSAKLPVAFGGQTPEGKAYGANTLVTVGSLVLIGFLEGNKQNPIVLNIYGESDNQSRLTRTTYTGADESDEALQRELWQLFTLYPSMTYENIDGNGNKEVTFSGKTFMYITDTDPDNAYVQDGGFNYEDLPSARYSDGELIEPKSPNSPTVLYVHQGIYDKHRVTFFIKSDGTVRLGSRHTEGTGVTFMELTTTGGFRIIQQEGDTNPEVPTEAFSQIGIEDNGDVTLKSRDHKFEIKEDGLFVDGQPLATIGGGTDPEEIDDILKDIEDLQNQIDNIDTSIGEAFRDGIIEESEAKTIQSYLNTIRSDKASLDAQVVTLSGNTYLPQIEKDALTAAKGDYNTKVNFLLGTIETAIQDGKATEEEATMVDQAFDQYRASLSSLTTAVQNALNAIALAQAKEAGDEAIEYTKSEVIILNNAISSKVESKTFTDAIEAVDSQMATMEENLSQEITDTNDRIDGIETNVAYTSEIVSTNGNLFKNGAISTTLFARVSKGSADVTDTLAASQFIWTRVSDDAAGDATWNSQHSAGAKSINITTADVYVAATFTCTVKNTDGQADLTTAQITLINLNDFVPSPTEPENPTEGMVWLKTAGDPPYRFYVYKDGAWKSTDYESLQQLDPEEYNKVQDAFTGVTNLDSDSKLTRYERSVVRGELGNITGKFLTSTEAMPTLTELDEGGIGQVYAMRQAARALGVPTTETAYVNYGNSYTALRTYLSSLTPKAWDTSDSTVATVDSTTWDDVWNEYYLRYNLLNVVVQQKQREYADAVGEGSVQDAIEAVTNAGQYGTEVIANPTIIDSPLTGLGLPEFEGRHVDSWEGVVDPQATWADNGNRIKPITSPIFTAAGSLTLLSTFYGDGTVNDTFSWDSIGRAVKVKRWEDTLLDGTLSWTLTSSNPGYKIVSVANFASSAVAATIQGVKYDGSLLTTVNEVTGANQVQLNSDLTLTVGVSEADSGWGDSYTPTVDEIKAYFYGWRMCNGVFDIPYEGTGSKVWYPIGDTDLSRSTRSGDFFNPVPTSSANTISEQTINNYQVVYRLNDPVQEIVDFNGILTLLKGNNEITITYPTNTPAITKGHIKYAINLATVTEGLRYIIPVLQNKIQKAEQVIQADSIVATVTQSREYQLAMKDKANLSDLGSYATNDSLANLSDDVNDRIGNALDNIDFSPYVTQSQLQQEATNITAKFSATGGMNLLRNSVGFAGLDFWAVYTTEALVETLNTNELDMLGYGSGFLFNPDGVTKGISQDVDMIPGQPYNLSWKLNKRTSGADGSYRFAVQIIEDGVITHQIADNSAQTTTGYEGYNFTFTPQAERVTVRFLGYGNVDATLTGAMLTIGDIALQWSLATGELYNTNVRMDINGVRVSQFDENGREVSYTRISPEEFAGYSDSEGNGVFRKVFYLNGDETVTTKLRATEEINMGKIKIINDEGATRSGWAFVPNID